MHIVVYTIACLLVCVGVKDQVNSDSDLHRVQEFFVEHEISGAQAKSAVQKLDPDAVKIGAGCKECTREEIRYCLGSQLINDHCCCDRRYNEYFPYVPHTCYIGDHLCKTLANDCATYTRLRTCCCDKYVLKKWKAMSQSSRTCVGRLLVVSSVISIYIFT